MKKSTIIALAACGVGILLLITGRLLFKGEYKGDNGMIIINKNMTEKSFVCTNDIDKLVVNETCYKARVTVKDVEKAEVRYFLNEEAEEVTVEDKNGELNFKREQKKGIRFDFISFDVNDYATEIVLPKDFKGELIIKGISGGLEVREITGTNVVVESSSGAVKVDNIKAGKLDVSTVSGSLKLNDAEVVGDLQVEASSGRVEINNIKAAEFKSSSVSGMIKLKDAEVAGDFGAEASSGRVEITNVKCKDFSSSTTSGANEIRKIEAKNADVSASSGAVGCYEMTVTGNIKLTSVSGLIKLEESSAENVKSESGSGAQKYIDVKLETIYTKSVSGAVSLERLDIGSAGEFHTSSGGVRGSVKGKESDFSVITTTGSGSSNLTNTRTGEKKLDITTTSGGIRITFEK
ncbi:MAG: DUF4097 domain-containing protein [Lachnospiraceae bacterium]|nr:DUF4097 domain-containing protein [Lachnospiraceae bacterium]